MRKWIEESQASWPETIEGWRLAQMVQDWHHTPEDFFDGDLDENICAFGTYHLKLIPVSMLKHGMFSINDDLVDQYVGMDGAAPPIVVDSNHNHAIDGNHRLEAAIKRGDANILAYVGDPSTYSPPDEEDDEDDEDDEWHPDGDALGFIRVKKKMFAKLD